MQNWTRIVRKLTVALIVTGAALSADISTGYAQSATCAQLNATLQTLNRNNDFHNIDQTNADAKALEANVRGAESAYVRTGCQDAQQARLPQTPECHSLAKQILSGRATYNRLTQSQGTGNAVAQQRESVLQEIARFGCGQGSRIQVYNDNSGRNSRRPNFLQQLFGGFQRDGGYNDNQNDQSGQTVDDPYANEQTRSTIRTVCVRKSDGYYWPVSYATLPDYLQQDASQCQGECPGADVELYYYDNPGQEPEQMVSINGVPYRSLPTAFAYRKQIDPANTCKPETSAGSISLVDQGNGESRAIVNYADLTFPLPLPDPRRVAKATTLPQKQVAYVDVPLPRPRPTAAAPGEAPLPTAEPVISAQNRTVKVGDKIVRIVGPDTPYAPSTGAGT